MGLYGWGKKKAKAVVTKLTKKAGDVISGEVIATPSQHFIIWDDKIQGYMSGEMTPNPTYARLKENDSGVLNVIKSTKKLNDLIANFYNEMKSREMERGEIRKYFKQIQMNCLKLNGKNEGAIPHMWGNFYKYRAVKIDGEAIDAIFLLADPQKPQKIDIDAIYSFHERYMKSFMGAHGLGQ